MKNETGNLINNNHPLIRKLQVLLSSALMV